MNPSYSYEANLAQFGLAALHNRRQELCDNQFERISTTLHKLSSLLLPSHCPNRHLRKCHEHDLPQIHTTDINTPSFQQCLQSFKNLR